MLPYCLQYCESVITNAAIQTVVIGFLAELCLRNNPITISDSTVTVPLPSTVTFVLDISHEGNPSGSVKQTPRRSKRWKNQYAVIESLASVLSKMVDVGLRVLKQILTGGNNGLLSVEEEGVLERLWCALVCVQHTRYHCKKSWCGVILFLGIVCCCCCWCFC